MINKKYYVLNDIADIFKGYSITKLKDSAEQLIDNKDKTNTNFQDFISSEKVKILGWKQIKDYLRNHKVDDNCNVINISRRYNKNIKYMQKGDIVFPVLSSEENFDVLYIDEEPKEKYIYNESVLVVRTIDSNVDSKYLYIMFTTTSIQKQLLQLTNQKKTVMSRLTKDLVSSIQIATITESERKQIVDEYTKLHSDMNNFIDKINTIQNQI